MAPTRRPSGSRASPLPGSNPSALRAPLEAVMREAGELGRKSGKGFYDWSGQDPDRVKAEAARKLTDLLAYLKQHR